MRNPVNVTLSDGSIRNTYDLRLRNKHGEDRWFTFTAFAPADVTLDLEGTEEFRVLVKANETRDQRLYITAAAGSVAAATDTLPLRLWITDADGPTLPAATEIPKAERVYKDTVFHGKAD